MVADRPEGATETLAPLLPLAIEERAMHLLRQAADAGLRIATAESCTGGLVAALLTDVEGCSHSFERGFVVYSVQAKQELLGVDAGLIARAGVVSRPVAEAMARGALAHSGADLALAVTGYAGSRGSEGEPGLVHFACAARTGWFGARECRFGPIGRGPVRIACLSEALLLLERALAAGQEGA